MTWRREWRRVRAIALKDLTAERRSKASFNAVTALAVTMLVLFGFALGPDTQTVREAAPGVIWLADQPLHGPDEVLANWKGYFDGPSAPFSWAPEIVEVQAGGKLALSTGPVLDPAGKRVGTYTSIWRHEPNGEWKIIFDRGCPVCDCAAKKE